MNRNLVKSLTVCALVMSASLVTSGSAEAGFGLLAKLKSGGCGGGLFARLCAPKDCCEPEPVCCEPEPVCCAPEPTCCEPAPEPVCCEPAPEPTCCEAAPVVEAPCCGGEVMMESAPMEMSYSGESVMSTEGYDLAPGETLVPGSMTTGTAEAAPAAEVAPEAPAAEAGDAVPSSSDQGDAVAPPMPKADPNTDI